MRTKYAWLMLPPVLALIVFFGPMQSLNKPHAPVQPAGTTSAATAATAGTSATKTAATGDFRAQVGSQLPEIPDIWQIGCSLLGVILLGVVFVMLAKRCKGTGVRVPAGVLSLRQSLRLSPKHHVHVVQFEDRVLLLGAGENNLTVLLDSDDNGAEADERELARRRLAGIDPEDDGAVPRDMILPRPDAGARQRKLPRRPQNPRPAPRANDTAPTHTSARRAAPRPGRATSDVAEGLSAEKLATFRALLKKAGQGAST